ncbi:hypothetical protein Tco_0733894 [Tanacetum coccineum]
MIIREGKWSYDPYLIVRQAHTPVAIDTKSELEEAPSKTEELHPLAARTTPPSSDHTPTSSDPTPVSPLTDEEFEASEPSDTRVTSSHSTAPSDSTTPTARMAVHTQLAMSPGLSARVTEGMTLSPLSFCKRYQGTFELIKDIEGESLESDSEREGSEDEGLDLEDEDEEEEAEPEWQPQQAVQVVHTAIDEPLGLGYEALRRQQQRVEETPAPRPPVCATWVDPMDDTVHTDIPIYVPLVCVPVQIPPSPEWSSGSLPVSPSSPAVPTPVASPIDSSPVASPATVEAESFLAELGAHVELQGGLIQDHIQRLDALPPALLRSLKQEQERATVTFDTIWRPVLALESWAGHVDAQRTMMWQARYDYHRLIHDLLVQNTTMQRELQELRERVTTLEREGSRSGQ